MTICQYVCVFISRIMQVPLVGSCLKKTSEDGHWSCLDLDTKINPNFPIYFLLCALVAE